MTPPSLQQSYYHRNVQIIAVICIFRIIIVLLVEITTNKEFKFKFKEGYNCARDLGILLTIEPYINKLLAKH